MSYLNWRIVFFVFGINISTPSQKQPVNEKNIVSDTCLYNSHGNLLSARESVYYLHHTLIMILSCCYMPMKRNKMLRILTYMC